MEELLIARDITKSFNTNGQQLHILNGINLTIYKGEMIAIMGASGVGKSTLLNILGTLDRPTSGEVIFEGADIFGKSDEELAYLRNKRIGFVFQFHHLLPEFTALENTLFPAMILKMNRREALDIAEKPLKCRVERAHDAQTRRTIRWRAAACSNSPCTHDQP